MSHPFCPLPHPLIPLRLFLSQHSALIAPLAPRSAAGNSWDVDLAEEGAASFQQQVQSLAETVKQMDSALQRRSKARATGSAAGSGAMSDSEKIALQISLDVKAFVAEIALLGVSPALVPSLALLEAEVERFLIVKAED